MITSMMMRRDDIIAALERGRGRFVDFHVASLSIFGSAARDEMSSHSDVDFLVRFTGPTTLEDYMGLKEYLEDLLGMPVDLVTEKALKPRIRHRIHDELIHVA